MYCVRRDDSSRYWSKIGSQIPITVNAIVETSNIFYKGNTRIKF